MRRRASGIAGALLACALAVVARGQSSDPPLLKRLAVVGPNADDAAMRRAVRRWRPAAIVHLAPPERWSPWRVLSRGRKVYAVGATGGRTPPPFAIATFGPHRLIVVDTDRLVAGGESVREAFRRAATPPESGLKGWSVAFSTQPLYDVGPRRWRALGRRLVVQPLLEGARVELVLAAGSDGYRRTPPVALDGWSLVHAAVHGGWLAIELEGPATARLIPKRLGSDAEPGDVSRLTRTPRGARDWGNSTKR